MKVRCIIDVTHSPRLMLASTACGSQVSDKNNKKLKGMDSGFTVRRLAFECVRTLWVEKRGVWCMINFEMWDRDHQVLTELGWSIVRWVDGKEVEEHRHYNNTYFAQHHNVSWPTDRALREH